jgi:hypothetical protein
LLRLLSGASQLVLQVCDLPTPAVAIPGCFVCGPRVLVYVLLGFGQVSFYLALRLGGSQTERLVGLRQARVALFGAAHDPRWLRGVG